MSVEVGTSSAGRRAAHAGYEKLTIGFTTGPGGTTSDVIDLAGELREAIYCPGTTPPGGKIRMRLRDRADSDIDYFGEAGLIGRSDLITYYEPLVVSDRAPVLIGENVFWVSDAAGNSDADASLILMLKT